MMIKSQNLIFEIIIKVNNKKYKNDAASQSKFKMNGMNGVSLQAKFVLVESVWLTQQQQYFLLLNFLICKSMGVWKFEEICNFVSFTVKILCSSDCQVYANKRFGILIHLIIVAKQRIPP